MDETSDNTFDRSKFSLSALFWTKGALRIIVSNATGFAASFFLHNAFSAPELRQGKKEIHFSPKRNLNTETASLNITYTEPNASNRVLDNGITDETVQPNHPFDGNAWDAPFFYDDARHSFYVTTTEKVVWIPQWNDFGIYLTPPKMDFTIPSIVFVGPKTLPDPIGPIIKQPGFGAVDPSPIERYVSEDAYIHQGIGTSGTVSYNGAEITLTGSQLKGIRTR